VGRKAVSVVVVTLAVALAVAACSEGDQRTEEEQRTETNAIDAALAGLRDCQTAGQDERGVLLLCQQRGSGQHGAFVVNDSSGRRILPIGAPGSTETAADAGLVGHWEWAVLSPDGSTFLAQWSAECEIPIAFFVSAEGGKPSVVTGEDDWATSPSSVALGWTKDGRAIILLPQDNPCGSIGKPGLYLVSVDGRQTRIRGLDPGVTTLPRSSLPRPAEALREK
jgi:hypothetical protein